MLFIRRLWRRKCRGTQASPCTPCIIVSESSQKEDANPRFAYLSIIVSESSQKENASLKKRKIYNKNNTSNILFLLIIYIFAIYLLFIYRYATYFLTAPVSVFCFCGANTNLTSPKFATIYRDTNG